MLLLEEYGLLKKWVIIMDKKQDSNADSTPAVWQEKVDLPNGIITVPEV